MAARMPLLTVLMAAVTVHAGAQLSTLRPKTMSLRNRSGLLDGRGSPKGTPQEYSISAGGMKGFWNLGRAAPLSGLVAPHLTDFSINNIDARPRSQVIICEQLIEGTGDTGHQFWRRRVEEEKPFTPRYLDRSADYDLGSLRRRGEHHGT